MAKAKKRPQAGAKTRKLYTLTQVSQEVGISMPTLQRYKKLYQGRIPSEGEGRKQRYPQEALKVFEQLKVENMARRGRPRKDAPAAASTAKKAAPKKAAAKKTAAKKTVAKKAAPKRAAVKKASTRKQATKRPAARKARASQSEKATGSLLSLSQIERLTGISYPTLMRYVKRNLAQLPHVGEGRRRRYQREAVAVFNEMREQSTQGRRRVVAAGEKAASATRGAVGAAVGRTAEVSAKVSSEVGQRVLALEKAQVEISTQIKSLIAELRKPIKVTIKRG